MITLKKKSSLFKNNLILLFLLVLIIFLILSISIFINIKYNFAKEKNGSFFFFYNEAKLFFKDADYYKNNFPLNYIEDIKDNKKIRSLFSPLLYYIFYPFTFFPEKQSFILFIILNFLLYIISINSIISYFKRLHKYRYIIFIFLLLFPPFIYTLATGNIAIFWFAILAFSFLLAKQNKMFLSGFVLSLFLGKAGFFILIFIIIFLSFKGRLFLGLVSGSILIILFTSLFFPASWGEWLKISFYALNKILYQDIMMLIKQNSGKIYFYTMSSKNEILLTIEYIFCLIGMFSLLCPIIYSFNNTKNFSRNSFWFIFTLTFVLASPYLYNYELIILALPIIILLNLMFADRVSGKVIIISIFLFTIIMSLLYFLSYIIYLPLLSIVLWFFLINAVIGKRIKHYMPKNFIEYWR